MTPYRELSFTKEEPCYYFKNRNITPRFTIIRVASEKKLWQIREFRTTLYRSPLGSGEKTTAVRDFFDASEMAGLEVRWFVGQCGTPHIGMDTIVSYLQ